MGKRKANPPAGDQVVCDGNVCARKPRAQAGVRKRTYVDVIFVEHEVEIPAKCPECESTALRSYEWTTYIYDYDGDNPDPTSAEDSCDGDTTPFMWQCGGCGHEFALGTEETHHGENPYADKKR